MRPGRKPPSFAPAAGEPDAAAEFTVSLKGAARLLGGVSISFVRALAHQKKVKSVVVGRRLTILMADLRRYLRELVQAQSKEPK
jgi:hypothetical protein